MVRRLALRHSHILHGERGSNIVASHVELVVRRLCRDDPVLYAVRSVVKVLYRVDVAFEVDVDRLVLLRGADDVLVPLDKLRLAPVFAIVADELRAQRLFRRLERKCPWRALLARHGKALDPALVVERRLLPDLAVDPDVECYALGVSGVFARPVTVVPRTRLEEAGLDAAGVLLEVERRHEEVLEVLALRDIDAQVVNVAALYPDRRGCTAVKTYLVVCDAEVVVILALVRVVFGSQHDRLRRFEAHRRGLAAPALRRPEAGGGRYGPYKRQCLLHVGESFPLSKIYHLPASLPTETAHPRLVVVVLTRSSAST